MQVLKLKLDTSVVVHIYMLALQHRCSLRALLLPHSMLCISTHSTEL